MLEHRPRQFVHALLLTTLIGVVPTLAQGTQDPGPEPVVFLSSNMVQGDLLRVDIDAQRFVVRQPNGSEVELLLNRRTTMAGVSGVRELATRTGSRVSVKFSRHSGDKIATSIRVHPKLESGQRREQPMPR
jgi:hypothetical protein